METPQQLSHKAIEEFRSIYQEEFGHRLSDDKVQEMALRLLRLFGILVDSSADFGSSTFFGSSEKFVLFIGAGDIPMSYGRDIVARDFRGFQEVPCHPHRGQGWERVHRGRAAGPALELSGLREPV